jgi:dolichol-phosphate mannosyltransferase
MTNDFVKQKRITIITPVYNEEENLDRYYQEINKKLLSLSQYEFEIILVDDGSRDKSWEKVLTICRLNSHFSAIRLSRNFGSHLAITAGLDRAHGDAAVILACDLQDPIETVVEFLKKWEHGYEIVWGNRVSRVDARWRVLASKLFNTFLKRWVMPKNSKFTTGSFLLIDRKVIDCFCLYEDSSRLTFAMVAWTGFTQAIVPYCRKPRQAGKTGWTFSNMISAFYNAVLAYSTIPLKFAAMLGILSFFLSISIGIYVFYLYFIGYTEAIGWKSTILAIIGFSGIILLQLSIIGEYLSRIYKDASRRPLYFVSEDTKSERYTVSRPWEMKRGC